MRNIHSWVLSYLVDYHDIFRGQSKPSFCQDIFLSIRWKWYQWFNFLIWNQTAWPLYWPEIWLYFTVCIRWLLVPDLFTWVCCIYHIEWNRLSIYTIYNYEVLYLYVIFTFRYDLSTKVATREAREYFTKHWRTTIMDNIFETNSTFHVK